MSECIGENCTHSSHKSELRPPSNPDLVGELRKYNQTIRFPRITECGHKYEEYREPRRNCEWCYFAWLNAHGEIVQLADKVFQEEGKDMLIKVKGEKFVKFWLRYMRTVAEFVKHQKESNGTAGEVATVREEPE
jgi:hypothetical protein